MSKGRNWGVRHSAKNMMNGSMEANNAEMPSYRYYGVRRRAHPLRDKLLELLWFGLAFALFAIYAVIIGLVAYGFFFHSQEMWIKSLSAAVIVCIIVLRMTKTLRRRRRFSRRLKKVCTNAEAQLCLRPKFVRSPAWQKNREDFRVEVGQRVFYVHYLMPKKYRSSVYLQKSGEIRVETKPPNNKFTIIFSRKTKIAYYSTEMKMPTLDGRRVIHAIVINPDCSKIFFENKDGGFEITGNGGEHNGFTVYTAKGFYEEICYNEEQ